MVDHYAKQQSAAATWKVLRKNMKSALPRTSVTLSMCELGLGKGGGVQWEVVRKGMSCGQIHNGRLIRAVQFP